MGFPGEALTAMMLPVFYLHNVIPSPQLFQNQMGFVYALYAALLSMIVIVFLLSPTSILTKVIQIPTRFPGLIILTLSFVGI